MCTDITTNVHKLLHIMLISDVSSVGHPVDARADVAHRAWGAALERDFRGTSQNPHLSLHGEKDLGLVKDTGFNVNVFYII